MIPFLTFGLAGMLRGEFGSWTGGMIVGFLGGLSLGLDISGLILFTLLNTLVFSMGWGKYIEAIQTGKRPIWGWTHLLKLNLLYLVCGLILPDKSFMVISGASHTVWQRLGWGLLAWPLAIIVDSGAKKYLKNIDSWKLAEFTLTAVLGWTFYMAGGYHNPIHDFKAIVTLFTLMGLYKYFTTEIINYRLVMIMLLLNFWIIL